MGKTITLPDGVPLFGALTDDEKATVAKIVSRSTFEAGSVVFPEGNVGTAMYIVESGAVQLSKRIFSDVEKNIMTVREFGVFGEMALVTGDARTAGAVALEKAVLLVIEKENFEKVADDNPVIGSKLRAHLLNVVAPRLSSTTDLYRRAIQWGLQVSGVVGMNFDQLIVDNANLVVELNNGNTVHGVLVKLENGLTGYEMLLRLPEEKFTIIPYNSIARVSFNEADVSLAT